MFSQQQQQQQYWRYCLSQMGRAFDATQYYSRAIGSTVFLIRDFSSNLPGNNLVLLGFGS